MDDFTPDRTDRRLTDALRERLSASPGPCPDAERLAAWSDGTVNSAEASALETHLADCARCQAIVSAFAAADELEPSAAVAPRAAAPATVIPFHRRPVMKWALPLAASLAASLVVWNVTRDLTPSHVDVPAESAQAMAAPDAVPPPTPLAPSPAAVQPAAPTTNQAAERRVAEQDMAKASADQLAQRSAAARERQASGLVPPPPPPPAFAPPPKPAGADARASTITGLPQSTLNVTIDGVSARPPARQDAAETVMLDAKPIAQFVSATALFRATADSAALTAQTSAAGGGGQAGAARAGGGRGGGAGRGGAGAVSAPAVEVAQKQERADPLTHWRILVGNRVERSRDNGLTWSAMTVEAELPAITNGAAPSGRICWLIGARGLVLVSTDATTFTRVTAPAEVDLISIRATDALNATVTAADGRTFTTTDGGKTWKGPGPGD